MIKILIVDDSEYKILEITKVIQDNIIDEIKIDVVRNVSDAMSYLINNSILDIMILDLNLPMRNGEGLKENAGRLLLKEITNRDSITKPEFIIGLTAHKEFQATYNKYFKDEGWILCTFNSKRSDWEEIIRNKISYILRRNKMKTIQKKNILFIASSPHDQSLLNAGFEQRKIEEALGISSLREQYTFVSKPGAKFDTISREILKYKPEIVHFTGHGDYDGIAFEKDDGTTHFVPSEILINLFSVFKKIIKCVILSACYSVEQAKAISTQNIFVIGMNNSVGVDAATGFSNGFYQALGEGSEVSTAFEIGLLHLKLIDSSQGNIPELWFEGNKINQ